MDLWKPINIKKNLVAKNFRKLTVNIFSFVAGIVIT